MFLFKNYIDSPRLHPHAYDIHIKFHISKIPISIKINGRSLRDVIDTTRDLIDTIKYLINTIRDLSHVKYIFLS